MPAITEYLTGLLHRKQPETSPPITTSTAIFLLVLYTLLYVIPFYLSSKTRPSPRLSRDAVSVIRARITSVSITCALTSLTTLGVLTRVGGYEASQALHALGYWPLGLVGASRALLLTALLFLGPLYELLIVEDGWRAWARLEPVRTVFVDWSAWRNYVMGPLTEELLFRSAAIPLMLLARTPLNQTIFLSPLVFGLAHVHHLYEFRVTHRGVPMLAAVLRSAFQLSYTTLFGAYATFLYLRTGSLVAVFAVHALCNCMGLPRVWGAVVGRTRRMRTRVVRQGGGNDETVEEVIEVETEVGKVWTIAYYVLLVVGAGLWYRGLWSLTESGNALVSFE
ncbi:CaaX protease [Coniella lustricola]|uniref:intramembrane prenyl-peptidase Rce1 n=1 Tax=Coniella lustricola TaxID=2025994 RepID=A0A2T3A5N2_9PEZI|nr:CaaX protease [Coniella lustricola]